MTIWVMLLFLCWDEIPCIPQEGVTIGIPGWQIFDSEGACKTERELRLAVERERREMKLRHAGDLYIGPCTEIAKEVDNDRK